MATPVFSWSLRMRRRIRVKLIGKFTVFDIGGNKYRLITAIHYNRKKVYIRHVLTHTEYNREKWKESP